MQSNRNLTLMPPCSTPWQAKQTILFNGMLLSLLFFCTDTYGLAFCTEGDQFNLESTQCTDPSAPTVCTHLADNQLFKKSYIISNSTRERELGNLILEFRKGNIALSSKIITKSKLNWIKRLRFHFTHPRGMDYTMKITGFQKLKFNLFYNDQDQLIYFTYRIDNDEVYSKIRLHTQGFKNYVCHNDKVVVSGDTNEDIVRSLAGGQY